MSQFHVGARPEPSGTLRISREVLTSIAKTAATEVFGVYGFAPVSVDFKGILCKRQLPKAIGITLADDTAEIELHLIVAADVKIPVVAEEVQRSVKEAIQSMTNITVSKVHVIIEGIHFAVQPEQE